MGQGPAASRDSHPPESPKQFCAAPLCQDYEGTTTSCVVATSSTVARQPTIGDPDDSPARHFRRSTAPPTPWSLSSLLNRGHLVGCIIWLRPDLVIQFFVKQLIEVVLGSQNHQYSAQEAPKKASAIHTLRESDHVVVVRLLWPSGRP